MKILLTRQNKLIFDNDRVNKLIDMWCKNRSEDTLNEILELSRPLVEAIVSQYSRSDRDDLIQEANAKLLYAIPMFDCKRGNLHTFFTTVIHNSCKSYVKKQHDLLSENELSEFIPDDDTVYDTDDFSMLQDCVERNEKRFPSIEDSTSITAGILLSLLSNSFSINAMLNEIVTRYNLTRRKARAIINSTLIYMRIRTIDLQSLSQDNEDEFSLIPDFIEVTNKLVPNDIITKIRKVFRGIPIRF